MKSLRNIESREDIKLLVDTFYAKVNRDPLLSPVFNDVAKVHWESHLPTMYNFWSSMLLGDFSYQGNPFLKHIPLPIEKLHFDRWLHLFDETIHENFIGEKAEEAKKRAGSIAAMFQHKLAHLKQ